MSVVRHLLVVGAAAAIAACQSVPDPADLSQTATAFPVVRFNPWPAEQVDLLPGQSSSLTKAPSFAGLAIDAPRAEADPQRAAYLGEWRGWMCVRRAYDVAVAITSLAGSRAAFTFGWASLADGVPPQQSAMRGQFISGSLIRLLPKSDLNYGVNMRLREDGSLDIQRVGLEGSTLCFGVLERVRGAPPALPPEAAPQAEAEAVPEAAPAAAPEAPPEAAKPDASDTSLELVTPPGTPPRSLLAPAPESLPPSR
jgi:hypothetical protein